MKKIFTTAAVIIALFLPIGVIIGFAVNVPSYTEYTMRALGPPAGLIRTVESGGEAIDGTAPERAWITYEIPPVSEKSIQSYYRDICQKQGKRTVPTADEKKHHPDAVCFGEFSYVEVTVQQKPSTAFVYLEVVKF